MKRTVLALLMVVGCGGGGGGSTVDSGPGGDDGGGDDGGGDDGGGDDGSGDDGGGDDGSGDDGDDDIAEYVSGTRIRRRIGTTPDGAKLFLGWRDTMRNEDCAFALASDGVMRCLPTATAFIVGYFADAQCSVELGVFTQCPGAPARGYVMKTNTASCGTATTSILPITGTHSGPIFVGNPAQCNALGSTPPFSIFTVGSAIPPSMFQSMTEAVE